MKEITIKFESEADYNRFMDTIIKPEVINGNAQFDETNKILIIKNQD